MKTLSMILNEAKKMEGYKAGQNAADFRNSNQISAKKLAGMINKNIPKLVKEISCAVQK